MKINNLLTALKSNRDNLESFLKVIEEQKNSLISNDNKLLEVAIIKEEKLLNNISSQQKKIIMLLKDLSEELNLNMEGNKFPKINDIILAIEKDNHKEAGELSKIHSAMKEVVIRIDTALRRNKILIDHSRNFIRETFSALANPSQPILDRKV
jgi:uncharacterized protein YpuA (DUF1002 family)